MSIVLCPGQIDFTHDNDVCAEYFLLLIRSFIHPCARRVHISEKTYGFLNGEFEVEPGFGERREESLRIAGLKTYFITKVLKPVIYYL